MNSQAIAESLVAAAEMQQRMSPPGVHLLEQLEEDPGRVAPAPPSAGFASYDDARDVLELYEPDENLDEDDEHDTDDVTVEAAAPTAAPARVGPHRLSRDDERRRKAIAESGATRAAVVEKERGDMARVQTWLEQHPDGGLAKRIATELGISRSAVAKSLQALVLTRKALPRPFGSNQTLYIAPKPGDLAPAPEVRTLTVPDFDRPKYGETIAQIFAAGTSFSLDELVKVSRQTWPQSDRDLVLSALSVLMEDERVEQFSLGSFVRYRRRAAEKSA